MTFETLHTKRLILRKIDMPAYDYLYSHYTDKELMAFLGLTPGELDEEKEKYAKNLTTFNRSLVNFQLIDRENNELIGYIVYHSWAFEHFRSEIGYALKEEKHKKKGLMSEALEAVLRYGFEQMQLNRVEAFIGPDNEASQKLVVKFGFRQEGHLREHYCKNGRIEDSLVFGLVKKEWKAALARI